MRLVLMLVALCALGTEISLAGVRGVDQTSTDKGSFSHVKCGTNLVCAPSSGKFLVEPQHLITVTTTKTLTAADCGSSVVVAGNTAQVSIVLPAASGVPNCRFSFFTNDSDGLNLNPNGSDQILVLTNSAGDSLTNATAGNSLVLEAISSTEWAPVGKEQGTWTDAN